MTEDLGDTAQKLETIIDSAIDGIITIDQFGVVESMNKAAVRLFGYEKREVLGQNVKMLMPEPHKSAHDQYLQSYVDTRKAKIIGIGREVMGKMKSGALFPFKLAVSEVILNDRVIFTGIIHDLTSIRSVETKLKKANTELERRVEERTNELEDTVNQLLSTNEKLEIRESELKEALIKEKELGELKSRFVSMASHEFRTPLSTILSSAALISRYKTESQDENRLKHINRIKSAVTNLTGILNDFLSLSKLEEGHVKINKTEVDLSEICKDVMEDVVSLLKSSQRIDHSNLGQEQTIISDPRILKNILFNLISNAIKYSPSDSPINCTTKIENGTVEFKIADRGRGIPEREQKHLFTRFFRASNVETIQGTGLGLNIVKRYVELLNGEIFFKSKEGIGTTFYVKLPIEL